MRRCVLPAARRSIIEYFNSKFAIRPFTIKHGLFLDLFQSLLSSLPFRIIFSPRPCFRVCLFLSLLFSSFHLSFFPVCTSVCLCLYLPFCFFAFRYLLLFFLLCFILFFSFLSARLVFASLVYLVAECVCLFFFVFASVLHPSRYVRA